MRSLLIAFLLLISVPTVAQPFQAGHMLDCGTLSPAPLLDPDDRLVFRTRGFSVKPPTGYGWCLAVHGPEGALISGGTRPASRIGTSPTPQERLHSLYLTVLVRNIAGQEIRNASDLLAFAKSQFVTKGRFVATQVQLAIDTSLNGDCVRADLIFEERDNPLAAGKTMTIVNRPTVMCLHPQAESAAIVELTASERHVSGSSVDPLLLDARKEEIEVFVRSLKFTSP